MSNLRRFICPHCGKKLAIKEEDIDEDTIIRCPYCGQMVRIKPPEMKSDAVVRAHRVDFRELRFKKAQVASILLILSSILGFIFAFTIYTQALPSERPAYISGRGSVFGTVLDENGTGLKGVKVYIVDLPEIPSVYTDERGYFIIHNIPSGKHTLRLELHGYRTVVIGVDVEVDKTTLLEITMKKGTGIDTSSGFSSHIEREEYIDRRDINIYFTYILFASSIAALIGGITSYIERFYYISLVGAIGGIVAIGFILGTIMSVLALALIILSKEEFE